jgi:hypothetical protein
MGPRRLLFLVSTYPSLALGRQNPRATRIGLYKLIQAVL